MKFTTTGFEDLGKLINPSACNVLLKSIYKTRNFQKIFLTEKEYKKQLRNRNSGRYGFNPRPGRNLLHKFDTNFIFEENRLDTRLKKILGNKYSYYDTKLVMGMPLNWVPEWIKLYTEDWHSPNLNQFIKPHYRDITYFKGLDFHQDIIDYPSKGPNFVTVYVYLEKVTNKMSPLVIIPRSHKFGATLYPHRIVRRKKTSFYYPGNNNQKLKCKFKYLYGSAGSVFVWHPFILHGTQPNTGTDTPRISIRMIVEKDPNSLNQKKLNHLDKINKQIMGHKSLKITSDEFDKKGALRKKGNQINPNLS